MISLDHDFRFLQFPSSSSESEPSSIFDINSEPSSSQSECNPLSPSNEPASIRPLTVHKTADCQELGSRTDSNATPRLPNKAFLPPIQLFVHKEAGYEADCEGMEIKSNAPSRRRGSLSLRFRGPKGFATSCPQRQDAVTLSDGPEPAEISKNLDSFPLNAPSLLSSPENIPVASMSRLGLGLLSGHSSIAPWAITPGPLDPLRGPASASLSFASYGCYFSGNVSIPQNPCLRPVDLEGSPSPIAMLPSPLSKDWSAMAVPELVSPHAQSLSRSPPLSLIHPGEFRQQRSYSSTRIVAATSPPCFPKRAPSSTRIPRRQNLTRSESLSSLQTRDPVLSIKYSAPIEPGTVPDATAEPCWTVFKEQSARSPPKPEVAVRTFSTLPRPSSQKPFALEPTALVFKSFFTENRASIEADLAIGNAFLLIADCANAHEPAA